MPKIVEVQNDIININARGARPNNKSQITPGLSNQIGRPIGFTPPLNADLRCLGLL